MFPRTDSEAIPSDGSRIKIVTLIQDAARAFARYPFRPHPLLKGGHAQTLGAYLWPRPYRFGSPRDEERLFEIESGVNVLAHCRWHQDRTSHPTAILWHGIEGSSSSVYMIATADKAFRAGFNVVRVNFRNCGGTEHLTPTLYHGGLSSDLRAIIDELVERDRLRKLCAIGFSLGGNIVLKLAAEYSDAPRDEVVAMCAVSPSVNLQASSDLICDRSNWIYHRDFVKRLCRRIKQKDLLYPGRYDLSKIPLIHTLRDFDEHFTAAVHGFRNADDYYYQCSSIHIIDKITLPTLIVHAQDDPLIPFAPLRSAALQANPHILLLDPQHGGHVAFLSAQVNNDKDRFWAENRAVEFCYLATK
jgi:predicted alpha/beta-fold hydrolase